MLYKVNRQVGGEMCVLGKVDKLQLVKIQSTQSVTDSVEPNLTYGEVTNHAKLRGGMYWA